jgi:hypothetical protein
MDDATEFITPPPMVAMDGSRPTLTLIATDDARPTSKSITSPPQLQLECPGPASDGVRHHLQAPHGDPESRCSCNCLHLPMRGSISPLAPIDRDPVGRLIRDDSPSITILAMSGCNIYIL